MKNEKRLMAYSPFRRVPFIENGVTATELAAMRIPGLPTSKPAIIARAQREGWRFEEGKGRGGKHRLYELPERYTSNLSYLTIRYPELPDKVKKDRRGVDIDRLFFVLEFVDGTLSKIEHRKNKLKVGQKSLLAALLYSDSLEMTSEDEIESALDKYLALIS